jgi:hypothetical protein
MHFPDIPVYIWCKMKSADYARLPVVFVFSSLPPGVTPLTVQPPTSSSYDGSSPYQPICDLGGSATAGCMLNLAAFYNLRMPGNYTVHAMLKLPGTGGTAPTPSITFSVVR